MAYSILVLDDVELTVRLIKRALREEGYEVFVAMRGDEALKILAEEKPDLALLDVVVPGMDGIEVLRQIKLLQPGTVVVMMSAFHMVERAVEAMKLGAYDYLVKPFHISDLLGTVQRAVEMLSLRLRVRETVESAKGLYDLQGLFSRNVRMREILQLTRKAAESDKTTILILGESGTGKGVLARAIHYNSQRAAMPLIELNCAALPDTLLESELFGFEPGAFTDARRRKQGLLERADKGTLLLDEISNMSPSVQAKLLRVLEEGTFIRLGGTRTVKVDVRIIAATNADLKKAVAQGRFREDLFYRVNVVPITLLPLRERKEDIVPLALDMMRKYNHELKKHFTGFTPAAAELLMRYPWPGNIRELRNVVERSMILTPSQVQVQAGLSAAPTATEAEIDVDVLPEEIRDLPVETEENGSGVETVSSGGHFITLRELEERYINEVLVACRWNKTQAARILGIHPTSILRRLKEDRRDKKGRGDSEITSSGKWGS
jgi:two-component system response regulator AtoC